MTRPVERSREPGPAAPGEGPPAPDDPGAGAAGAEGAPPEGAQAPGAPDAGGGVGEDAAALRDRWLRAEAELQNFRRRAAREREEARRLAEESVLLELIAVLDDLERALAAPDAAAAPAAWAEGVRLVAQRVQDVLGRHGVTALDPRGAPFDPAFHEALLEVDAPEGVEPGQVAHVVLKGYARGGRALRAARVAVARAGAGDATP